MNRPTGRAARRVPDALRVVGMYGVVLTLHVLGIALFVGHGGTFGLSGAAGASVAYSGAGLTVYALGLRHAFDVDHVAAIDDTTRYLVAVGRRPLGVGLMFSLGHASVVLGLCLAIAFAAHTVAAGWDGAAVVGSVVGGVVSVVFLLLVAGINGVVLRDLVATRRAARGGAVDEARLADVLARRGLVNRLLRGQYARVVAHLWQVFVVGLLFGLGFDTATQVGALALAAGSASGPGSSAAAILALPLLFAAGMTLADTTDGLLMARAYGWAAHRPLQRLTYNLTLTGVSVALAAGTAVAQTVGLVSRALDPVRGGTDAFGGLDPAAVGLGAVLLLAALWAGAALHARARQPERLEA